MVMNPLGDRLPPVSQEVAERHKRAGPQKRAQIGEQRENMEFHGRDSRRVGRQMADARHEIAKRQAPVAHPLEEPVSLGQALLREMHVFAKTMDERQTEYPAERVT